MNHNNKAMWLIMASVAVVGILVASVSRLGGIAILFLICPISMVLMMVFMMRGTNHGDDTHKH